MLAHVLMLLFLVAAALVLLGSIQADQKKPVMERQDRRDGGHDGLTAREKLLKRQQEEKAMAAAYEEALKRDMQRLTEAKLAGDDLQAVRGGQQPVLHPLPRAMGTTPASGLRNNTRRPSENIAGGAISNVRDKHRLGLKESLMYEALYRRQKFTEAGVRAEYGRHRQSQQSGRSPVRPGKTKRSVNVTGYALTEADKDKLKAIAIVFPQYHAIPENDLFWGEGFTEWTMLRPVPRMVNGITTRRPHPDVGYYNFLDLDHRRYMRILADHFGVFGFCFYHYWFKDGPVMHRPLEMLLLDGEPDKPFFLTWANEPWSRRWDGSNDDVLLAQDYSDAEGNVAHFLYLLPFFQHRNYMDINGMPLFCFYRLEAEDIPHLLAIMKLWTELAIKAGLPGIYFMQFSGYRSRTPVESIKARVEFEPLHSWVRTSTGPSIFGPGGFDVAVFEKHNQKLCFDLRRKGVSILQYMADNPVEFKFLSSQFSVYDKISTWQAIEAQDFAGSKSVYRGTYCHWSNVPRRNFTNGNYASYPHMMTPDSISGCAAHLLTMAKVVAADPTGPPQKLLFLTAWNEWNEQSVFEPTDVDGYDALSAVKAAFRKHTSKRVVHIGGGTPWIEQYIRDLMSLFDHYDHARDARPPDEKTALLHVHSVVADSSAAANEMLELIARHKRMGIPVYLTVHDYHIIFPNNRYPTTAQIATDRPRIEDKVTAALLLSAVDTVIFPSYSIKMSFVALLGKLLEESAVRRFQVVPHNDVLECHKRFRVPRVDESTVHIALVGPYTEHKGSALFASLVKNVLKLQIDSMTRRQMTTKLQFQVLGSFGAPGNFDLKGSLANFRLDDETMHQLKELGIEYRAYVGNDTAAIEKVHILLYLPQTPEAYCPELAPGINTGLPIVYLNTGALGERLGASQRQGLFPVETESDLEKSLSEAVTFVLDHQGSTKDFHLLSPNLQPRKWYIENYPILSSVVAALKQGGEASVPAFFNSSL